jgi:hypothetical protein
MFSMRILKEEEQKSWREGLFATMMLLKDDKLLKMRDDSSL